MGRKGAQTAAAGGATRGHKGKADSRGASAVASPAAAPSTDAVDHAQLKAQAQMVQQTVTDTIPSESSDMTEMMPAQATGSSDVSECTKAVPHSPVSSVSIQTSPDTAMNSQDSSPAPLDSASGSPTAAPQATGDSPVAGYNMTLTSDSSSEEDSPMSMDSTEQEAAAEACEQPVDQTAMETVAEQPMEQPAPTVQRIVQQLNAPSRAKQPEPQPTKAKKGGAGASNNKPAATAQPQQQAQPAKSTIVTGAPANRVATIVSSFAAKSQPKPLAAVSEGHYSEAFRHGLELMQQMEVMKQEISRLEHVIDVQEAMHQAKVHELETRLHGTNKGKQPVSKSAAASAGVAAAAATSTAAAAAGAPARAAVLSESMKQPVVQKVSTGTETDPMPEQEAEEEVEAPVPAPKSRWTRWGTTATILMSTIATPVLMLLVLRNVVFTDNDCVCWIGGSGGQPML